jgi:myo-inositol 2-dehydrogenase/D-chiro-inositol 1-dehydrogenase
MSVGIGVVGAGLMGGSHIRTIATDVSRAEVLAVCDFDGARADEAAREAGGARVHRDPHELIRDAEVDAVLIASPAETHEGLVLACLEAGKPVLCEKPLATTAAAGFRVVEAEDAVGRRLVQVGFMRRYDPGFADMKATLDSGSLGAPLAMHCVHRNPNVPPTFTSEMHTTEALIHEIDQARWLVGQEIVGTTIYTSRATRHAPAGVSDPQFAVPPATVSVRRASESSSRVDEDFRSRFAFAYRRELEAWVRELGSGEPSGPSAWDGYAATVVAEACLRSLTTGARSEVRLEPRPELYLARPAMNRPPAFLNMVDTGEVS